MLRKKQMDTMLNSTINELSKLAQEKKTLLISSSAQKPPLPQKPPFLVPAHATLGARGARRITEKKNVCLTR